MISELIGQWVGERII